MRDGRGVVVMVTRRSGVRRSGARRKSRDGTGKDRKKSLHATEARGWVGGRGCSGGGNCESAAATHFCDLVSLVKNEALAPPRARAMRVARNIVKVEVWKVQRKRGESGFV